MTEYLTYTSIGYGPRGQKFRVEDQFGVVLVASCVDVTYSAARALVARGYEGPFEVQQAGKPFASMRVKSAAAAARWTVSEADRGARLVRYQPFTGFPTEPGETDGEG